MNPSRRIQALGVSPIRHLAPLARKAEERGIRVLPLNIGQPDLPTPRAYYEAIRSFDAPYTPYAPSQGLPELLEAIREDFRVRGVALDPESILVTAGGSEALLFSLLTLCDPGDEVLVAEPFYTNYNFFADTAGVKLVSVRTDPEEGYALPPDADLEARLSSRTRAVLVTNPNNPTGTVLPREDMERLGRFAARHDLFVLADEVYRDFVYREGGFVSFGELEEVRDRLVICDSVSKRFSACGVRVGCLATPRLDLAALALKLGQGRLAVSTVEQRGAAALYGQPPSFFAEQREAYRVRRDALVGALSRVEGVSCRVPEGAFYFMVRLGVEDTSDFAAWMLREFQHQGDTVMVAPGEGFYATPGAGRDEVRVAYAIAPDLLVRAAEVLGRGLEAYRRLRP